MFIGGDRVESESGESFEAINPTSGAVIATLPKGGRVDARKAIAAAEAARGSIAKMPVWERSRLCVASAEVMGHERGASPRR